MEAHSLSGEMPAPELIPPELDDFERLLLSAWSDLSGDRYTEMARIPFASVDRWAARNNFDDPDDFGFLARAVQAADGAFLAWAHEKINSK